MTEGVRVFRHLIRVQGTRSDTRYSAFLKSFLSPHWLVITHSSMLSGINELTAASVSESAFGICLHCALVSHCDEKPIV